MKHLHIKCLQKWLVNTQSKKNKENGAIHLKNFECELCKQNFPGKKL